MKHAETIKISILFCWLHLLYSLCTLYRRIPTNDDVLSRLTICVKTWSPVWNRHYVYNFCPGINGLIKYTYLVIHGETYWFFSRNTGIIFSKKGVNFNHYINLLKVRFKVYKMCTLKETSVRFLILMVRHHMQGFIYKFAKSSQVHFSLL